MRSRCILLTLVLPLLASTNASEPATPVVTLAVAAQDLRPHIEFLASPDLRGRSGADAVRAAEYVEQQMRKLGLKPLFSDDGYRQSIPDAQQNILGRNVGGWIAGSDPKLADEFVVIGVHFDHLGVRGGAVFSGADDNASGVAMMLEIARQIAKSPTKPGRSIAFVGFDLEEHMLWGSRWFAAHPPWPLERVKLFITADMIGRSLGDLPLPTVFVLGSEHAPQLQTALEAVGRPEGLEVARLGIDLVGTRSDYGPFRDRQVPFLFFSTGEHPDYHTPHDTPDRVDYDKAARITSLALAIIRQVADAEEAPVWTDEPVRDLSEPEALERITTLLLEAGERYPLSDVQRFLVSNVRNRCRRILEQKTMTPDDRTWLVRMAQVLLVSVF